MIEVISVRFRGGCKAYFFDPQGVTVNEGDEVVVETAQGAEFGTCVCANHMVEDHAVIQPLRPMRRLATDEDRALVARNRKREKEAVGICEQKIAAHGLDMKLVNVECSFEGNKVIFFFTADGRVDFRDLVKDLASVFHARIELRQIGVRDEAKMLGGLGICGQPFCCKRFLDDFQPVSIKMAKTQNLSLNPTKISGSCGRLMCCLKYEQHAYEDALTRMPKNDSFVQTPDGPGNVSAVNLVRETVTVRLDESPESPKTYQVPEIIVLRSGKGSRDGIVLPDRPARIEPEQERDPYDPIEAMNAERSTSRQGGRGGSAGRERRSSEKRGDREKRSSAAEQPKKAAKPAESRASAKSEKEGAKPTEPKAENHRSRRGSRGRGRGGENRKSENRSAEKPVNRQPEKQNGGEAPRPVHFGSSMPIAANAPGAGQGETAAHPKAGGETGAKNSGRRPRRSSHRGGRGSRRGGEKKES